MSQPNKPQFECLSCGKHFAWKPEIAGKKAKCTCGATVQVPMSIEIPPPPEPEDDGLIDFKDEPEEKPARRPAPAAIVEHDAAAPQQVDHGCRHGVPPRARRGRRGDVVVTRVVTADEIGVNPGLRNSQVPTDRSRWWRVPYLSESATTLAAAGYDLQV